MTSVVYKGSLRTVTKNAEADVRSKPFNKVFVNIIYKASIFFPVIGKKNNQSSVSDADQEIPTLGSTDNARNSGLGFLCLHRRSVIDSIYPLGRRR